MEDHLSYRGSKSTLKLGTASANAAPSASASAPTSTSATPTPSPSGDRLDSPPLPVRNSNSGRGDVSPSAPAPPPSARLAPSCASGNSPDLSRSIPIFSSIRLRSVRIPNSGPDRAPEASAPVLRVSADTSADDDDGGGGALGSRSCSARRTRDFSSGCWANACSRVCGVGSEGRSGGAAGVAEET